MVQVLIPQTTTQHVKVASMATTTDTTNSREIDSAGDALVENKHKLHASSENFRHA